jgi:hypothetical protein
MRGKGAFMNYGDTASRNREIEAALHGFYCGPMKISYG